MTIMQWGIGTEFWVIVALNLIFPTNDWTFNIIPAAFAIIYLLS